MPRPHPSSGLVRARVLVFAATLMALMSACERHAPPPLPASAPEPVTPAPAPTGQTLHDVIRSGDAVAFAAWLNDHPDVNMRDLGQATPLIEAAAQGRAPFVRALLQHGADPSLVDQRGFTALHAAANEGRAEVVRMLIEAGADPEAKDEDGLTAYDLAMLAGHRQAAELIAETRAVTPVITTATPPVEAEPEVPPAVLLSTDFRTWTSASGDRVEAAFIQHVLDTVILQQRDGQMFRIGINRLSAEDQVLARQLSGIDPHTLAKVRPGRRITPTKESDSLAGRIGKGDGWSELEGCRLLKSTGNDGDSFHVSHGGKEYIFRLYFVDAAETHLEYPDRVRDQSTYFGLDDESTLQLGKEAARYTTSLLAGSEFRVYTRWEDARGNSRLPRYYALVTTAMGDLDELLTREGLVRQYGMRIDGSDGDRKRRQLKKLEQEAKDNEAGAWKKHERTTRAP